MSGHVCHNVFSDVISRVFQLGHSILFCLKWKKLYYLLNSVCREELDFVIYNCNHIMSIISIFDGKMRSLGKASCCGEDVYVELIDAVHAVTDLQLQLVNQRIIKNSIYQYAA